MTQKPKANVRGTLCTMRVGQKATFPLSRAGSVRSTCALVSLETGKKFTTKTSRADLTITVTRAV